MDGGRGIPLRIPHSHHHRYAIPPTPFKDLPMPKTYEDIRDCTLEELKAWLETGELKVDENIDLSHNLRDIKNFQPLHIAVQSGSLHKVKLLISHGADIEGRVAFSNETPLILAAAKGDIDVISYLVSKGAQLETTDSGRWTPVTFALAHHQREAYQWLLDNGARTDHSARGENTLLHAAAYAGNQEWVADFIGHGMAIDVRNMYGIKPLYYAAFRGHYPLVRYLIDEDKAKTYSKDNGYDNALSWAAEGGHKNIIHYLITEKGANPDFRGATGNSNPLYNAVINNHKNIVSYLIEEHRCDPNTRLPAGRTILHWAAEYGYKDIVKYLLTKGANPNVKDRYGETPAHKVIGGDGDHEEILKMLVEKGTYLNGHEISLLTFAVMEGDADITAYLLEKGADPFAKDMSGYTPREHALRNGNKAVIQVLKTFEKNVTSHLPGAIAGGALVGMKQQLEQQHPSSLNQAGKRLASLPDEVLMNVGGWVARIGDKNDPGSLARVSKSALEGAKGERQKVLGKWTAKLEEERAQQGGEKGQGK